MAIRLGLYPGAFGSNDAYLFLMERYDRGETKWLMDDLQKQFSRSQIESLLDNGMIVKHRREYVRMSFDSESSVPNIIVKKVSEEICSFSELQLKLPKTNRCSTTRLKDCITFLSNFRKVQVFPLPASGITCVAADRDYMEPKMDYIFSLADSLESKFVYKANVDEGLEELARLAPRRHQ